MNDVSIKSVSASAYVIPTDAPEGDGTYLWHNTTIVVAEVSAGGMTGLGYTYANRATAQLILDNFPTLLGGHDAMAVPGAWDAMLGSIRNLGRPGVAAMAISAVDSALWDLKARLLGLPLVTLLGAVRTSVPLYGSGGFTTYTPEQLRGQLAGWAEQGFKRVKMKIGTEPAADLDRVKVARQAIGPDVELFVDANGAYSRKEALAFAEAFAELGVTWFEEPVSSDDLEGLRLLRDRAPAGMDIAAGEYGYDPFYFRRMLDAEAVDVLQADATRCLGISGFLKVGALCEARPIPLSAHCGPSIHAHPCCSVPKLRHLEYFHDHARIEHMFFDGALDPVDGELRPDLSRPGMGLELKRQDAEPYRVL